MRFSLIVFLLFIVAFVFLSITALQSSVAQQAPTNEELLKELQGLKKRIQELENQGQKQPPVSEVDEVLVDVAEEKIEIKQEQQEDTTGTDPRGFGTKFMPYYRYTELENNLEVNEFVLFGLVRFADWLAMTYELPVAKQVDYSNVNEFQNLVGNSPDFPGVGFPPIGGGGVPFDSLEEDGDTVGMGDLGLRFFVKPPATQFKTKGGRGISLMFGAELLLPTATDDILGSDTLVVSPMVVVVADTFFHGFIAGMNFYDFDAFKDDSRPNVSRYRGRWFYMQPLTPPHLGPILGGWYLLPEFQPVYDFETNDFDLWIAPELGKILGPGNIVYVKPGWGIDTEPEDRDFTFEVGYRYFF